MPGGLPVDTVKIHDLSPSCVTAHDAHFASGNFRDGYSQLVKHMVVFVPGVSVLYLFYCCIIIFTGGRRIMYMPISL